MNNFKYLKVSMTKTFFYVVLTGLTKGFFY